ncbi:uncharacterized protein SCDLUD_002298 [Saccharomycodes ludwigii]|uniref:uncharacterized protein n=1 Tax=Saccharomycodes ludwigii TaxID=36035 RepID=UPI001E87DD5F|nr:hypothetical protein SCDLUD_002298 [Saccharomycodes ludwigii]KAH3900844.1 hypothetical protein SCDLUD_002298 [Saccharomycodes ludwigii]
MNTTDSTSADVIATKMLDNHNKKVDELFQKQHVEYIQDYLTKDLETNLTKVQDELFIKLLDFKNIETMLDNCQGYIDIYQTESLQIDNSLRNLCFNDEKYKFEILKNEKLVMKSPAIDYKTSDGTIEKIMDDFTELSAKYTWELIVQNFIKNPSILNFKEICDTWNTIHEHKIDTRLVCEIKKWLFKDEEQRTDSDDKEAVGEGDENGDIMDLLTEKQQSSTDYNDQDEYNERVDFNNKLIEFYKKLKTVSNDADISQLLDILGDKIVLLHEIQSSELSNYIKKDEYLNRKYYMMVRNQINKLFLKLNGLDPCSGTLKCTNLYELVSNGNTMDNTDESMIYEVCLQTKYYSKGWFNEDLVGRGVINEKIKRLLRDIDEYVNFATNDKIGFIKSVKGKLDDEVLVKINEKENECRGSSYWLLQQLRNPIYQKEQVKGDDTKAVVEQNEAKVDKEEQNEAKGDKEEQVKGDDTKAIVEQNEGKGDKEEQVKGDDTKAIVEQNETKVDKEKKKINKEEQMESYNMEKTRKEDIENKNCDKFIESGDIIFPDLTATPVTPLTMDQIIEQLVINVNVRHWNLFANGNSTSC